MLSHYALVYVIYFVNGVQYRINLILYHITQFSSVNLFFYKMYVVLSINQTFFPTR